MLAGQSEQGTRGNDQPSKRFPPTLSAEVRPPHSVSRTHFSGYLWVAESPSARKWLIGRVL